MGQGFSQCSHCRRLARGVKPAIESQCIHLSPKGASGGLHQPTVSRDPCAAAVTSAGAGVIGWAVGGLDHRELVERLTPGDVEAIAVERRERVDAELGGVERRIAGPRLLQVVVADDDATRTSRMECEDKILEHVGGAMRAIDIDEVDALARSDEARHEGERGRRADVHLGGMRRAEDVCFEFAPIALWVLAIGKGVDAMEAACRVLEQMFEHPERGPALVAADLDDGARDVGAPALRGKQLAPVIGVAREPIGRELCHRPALSAQRRRHRIEAAGPKAQTVGARRPGSQRGDVSWSGRCASGPPCCGRRAFP
jgi:hypothetical protein